VESGDVFCGGFGGVAGEGGVFGRVGEDVGVPSCGVGVGFLVGGRGDGFEDYDIGLCWSVATEQSVWDLRIQIDCLGGVVRGVFGV
jgi:hypothetical protein